MRKNDVDINRLNKEAKTTPEGKERPIILQQLNVRTINRQKLDIGKWRNAVRSFESTFPNRVALYDIYFDCMLDGHLRSLYDKRLMAVTNIDYEFVDPNGKVRDDIQEWIDTSHFETTVTEGLASKLWGYTMLTFDFYKDGGPGVFLIPRKHMRPEIGAVTIEQQGLMPIPVREGKYRNQVVEIGEEKDLGLLATCAQYVIYKRGNVADWAQFNEVFGMPLIDAVWDGFDEEQRQKLLTALSEMGAGGQIVRPQGTELQFMQSTSTQQTGELYLNMAKFCNSEMSKAVLGQTETTESSESSGYAQAKEHGQTEDDIKRADREFVIRFLNTRIKRIFELNGWDMNGQFRVKDEHVEEINKKDQLDMAIRLDQAGVPVGHDYFYENFGIPKPDNYDELMEENRAKEEARRWSQFGLSDDVMPPKPDKGKPSVIKRLRSFFKAPSTAGADINLRLQELYGSCCQPLMITLADRPRLNEAVLMAIFKGELRDGVIDADYYTRVARLLTQAVRKQYKTPEFSEEREAYLGHLEHNIFAFSAAKNFTQLEAYRNELTDEQGELRSFGAFRQRVTEVDRQFNDLYLQAEYNSASRMGEMADKYEYLSRFEFWEYRTVGDDKVRASHRKLNGKVFKKDDAVWDDIYPPNDWGCRCTVIPAMGNKPNNAIEVEEGRKEIKPYFKKNLAKQKVVMPEDHPYFERVTANGIKLDELDAERNYGMRSVERMMSSATKRPAFTPLEVQEMAKKYVAEEANKISIGPDGSRVKLGPELGRIADDVSRFHLTREAESVVTHADEVWTTKLGGEIQTNYLRYYQDAPLVVSFADGKFNNLTSDPFAAKRIRKGLLKYRR